MPDRTEPVPPDTPGADAADTAALSDARAADPARPDDPSGETAPNPPSADDLVANLPIAGITRRRLTLLAAAIVSVWVVAVIVRQTGDATAATARVDATREANDELAANVSALEAELELIQRPEYIAQQARSYGLGGAREIPFSLGAEIAPLPPNAPGSAAERLGTRVRSQSPLETWLELLFGPAS